MVNFFIRISKVLAYPITFLVYNLSGLIRRDEHKWVFGSQKNSFTDNTKHLYIYILENEKKITPIWISHNRTLVRFLRSKGGNAYMRWSLKGLYYSMTSKYWFITTTVSDIFYYTSKNAVIVNLWHGVPLKKIYFDSDNKIEKAKYHNANIIQKYIIDPQIFKLSNYLVSSSAQISKDSFSSALKVKIDNCLNFGLCRNDILFGNKNNLDKYLEKWGSDRFKEIVSKTRFKSFVWLYMPTWRETDPNFMINLGIDFTFLDNILASKNEILVLKLHQYTPLDILSKLQHLQNIFIFPTEEDIYPFLKYTSTLITDYSSIYIDYLLLNKPIFHFCFDLQKFQEIARSFYYDFNSYSAGEIILDIEGFYKLFGDNKHDMYLERRTNLRKYFFDEYAGNSSSLITAFFKK
jgi:CDP-glycerol glycerophosphotransferase (TagB/SpsB family)